jgi:hypothetical protein
MPTFTTDLANQDAVIYQVDSFEDAAGFGLHVSSTAKTDGYGGTDAELHFVIGTTAKPGKTVLLVCYDGYLDKQNAQNQFRLDLGPKENLLCATVKVSRRAVDVEVVKSSANGYTNERFPYTVNSTFPLREKSGFWRSGKLYCNANGVLNGRSGREGKGYKVPAPETKTAPH